jgi:hypothetical protein
MAQAAAWYDALPTVAPPPGMMLPTRMPPPGPAAPAPNGSPLIATTATVPSGDDDPSSSTLAPRQSWHDAIPSVSPPPGMQLAAASPDDDGNSGSTLSGAWLNLNAGVDDVASTILGAPADLLGGAYNFLASAGNAAGAPRVPMVGNLPGGSADVMNTLEPQPIVPHGFLERAARSTGAGLASLPLGGAIGGMVAGAAPELGAAAGAALPGAAGTTAANVAGTVGRVAGGVADAPALPALIPTATGAVTGQAAGDIAPDAYKPYANLAGNLIGGGIGAIGQGLAAGGGSALLRAGGSVGIGPKIDIGGQRVTATQADIAANRLANAAGPDVGQFRDMLANAPEQLVPGSQPTTAQLAPVPGVVGLEQSLRTANGEPFAARAAQQNRARIGAIDAQAPADASPLSVGQYFTQQLDALQSTGSATLAQGRDLIGNATSRLGGTATPDAYGATAASAINAAQAPAIDTASSAADQALQQRNAAIAAMPGGRQDIPGGLTAPEQYGADARAQLMVARQQQAQQVSRLKAAINPTGDAGINSAPITQQVQQVYQGLSPNAAQPAGEEAAILARLQAMPSVVPLNDIFALRERVGDAISTEINAAGRTTTAPARRLMGIKTAIDDGLANAVDQQSAFEAQQVAGGQMQPGDTIQARMQAAAPGAPTSGAQPPLPGTGTDGTAPPLPTATQPGTGTSVFTPAGRQVAVNYELANLPDLVASHTPDLNPNPAFPPALQPRDRTRAASQAQIAQMAGNLQPERLGASASAGEGAPIIGPDNIVESGNGRVLALQQAYAANGPQAQAYRQFLARQGLDTSGMEQPVLVRRRVTPMSDQDRVAFTQEANASPALAMSATERAMAEGPTIPQETLALQQPGDIGSGANVPFVRSYLKSVVSPAERGLYVTDDGALSLEGQQRIRNALLARAYNNPNLISALAETGDPNIAAFGGALMDTAGPMANLRAQIEAGAVDRNVDISAPISQAVAAVQQAKRQRLSLPGFVRQVDAFNQMAPPAEEILKAAYGDDLQGRISRGRLGKMLSFYAQEAGKQTTDGRLFGNNLTMEQLLQEAKARYGTNNAEAGTSDAEPGVGPRLAAAGGIGGQPPADATGPQIRGGGQGGPGAAGARAGQQPGPRASVLPVAAPALRPLNADELAAYRAYKTQAQQLADTFDSRRVGEVLAPGDYRTAAQVPADVTRARGGFDTADAAVMARFWNKSATNAQDARDFLAAGGSPALLRDYAAAGADDARAGGRGGHASAATPDRRADPDRDGDGDGARERGAAAAERRGTDRAGACGSRTDGWAREHAGTAWMSDRSKALEWNRRTVVR